MGDNRRNFFFRLGLLGSGAMAARAAEAAEAKPALVETPDIPDLPFTMDGGVKVFHLIAEPVKQEVVPGRVFDLWGFNGTAPGPTIHANEGDRVRIVFDNRLPEDTAIHWHGFEVPVQMDGVPGIGMKPVKPGGRFVYEFTLHQNGTFFYHSHMAMQEMIGMLGAFILHPKEAYRPRVDRDYVILLQEYAVLPNSTVPNSMAMEYNWLTFNGKASPASTPLMVRLGDRVRIRLINLGMDHHPIHVHGHTFEVTGHEGARQPQAIWARGNTVLVGVAQARDIEFTANNPGDWMVHCHLPHHMMNQMSSNVGPMTRFGNGMQAGGAMEEGMGMLRSGNATSDDKAPALGRGLGVGSTTEQLRTNGPLSAPDAAHAMGAMAGMEHMDHMQHMEGMHDMPATAPNANAVPGFPQDAFMEGPMMAMDDEVKKPETIGLPAGWSGYMGGMMTLLRVMPPEQYEKYLELKRQAVRK